MADVSHLERMGRELKCPICLSLLNSAASLSCNHVFCKLCIEKSTKTALSCPVCKIPYRRRELRPAPHMDNLVNVYKSMEMESGFNIFVTQNEASKKLSAEINENEKASVQLDHEDQIPCGKNGSKKALKAKRRSSLTKLSKPSFPTKKRVQVSQFHASEAKNEPEMLEKGIGDNAKIALKKCSVVQQEVPAITEKRGHEFSPFFWLRDEDDLEKSSQQLEDDEITWTPPIAPCFSDIKDSDDEVPFGVSPKKGTCADFIDSEMFDWTQRPCSPELCSSYLAMQIEDTAEEHVVPGNADLTLTETNKGLMVQSSSGEGLSKKRMRKTAVNKEGSRTSCKKVNDSTETIQRKRIKRSGMTEVSPAHEKSDKISSGNTREENIDNSLTLKKIRKNKKTCHEVSAIGTSAKSSLTLSDDPETVADINNTVSNCPASKDPHKSPEESIMLKKRGRSGKSTESSPQLRKCGNEGETGKSNAVKDVNKDQVNQASISPPHLNLLPPENCVVSKGKVRAIQVRREKMPDYNKKVKSSVEAMIKDGGDCISLSGDDDTVMGQRRLSDNQCSVDKSGVKVCPKTTKKEGRILQKCNTFPITVICAFCQSSEESEDSGVMVHYLNGKPVSADKNAKTDSIHVHKNCAEWAPNVYFDNDNVVNLETELSRSRRIKCSCCGIKGAALGCYEKSCHRSFHVPCARKTPECRWDYENFVMVCPIHVSYQLPNEVSKAQSRGTRKSVSARKSCKNLVKSNDECRSSSNLPLKQQKKFKNLVLCCSGLTTEEKETIGEFQKLYGVTVMKNWGSNDTHVIASIDENGACRRTLKFLMGVLEGKWILNIQWIKACVEAGELVNEQQYEISVDIHGTKNGPKLGRLRLQNKEPKLFDGYKFFFTSDFPTSYKKYLHDLVIAAGGKVLNRKPVAEDDTTIIIYNQELPDPCEASDKSLTSNQRRVNAEALAKSIGAALASNTWILNSIAGHKLQNL